MRSHQSLIYLFVLFLPLIMIELHTYVYLVIIAAIYIHHRDVIKGRPIKLLFCGILFDNLLALRLNYNVIPKIIETKLRTQTINIFLCKATLTLPRESNNFLLNWSQQFFDVRLTRQRELNSPKNWPMSGSRRCKRNSTT